MTGVAEAVRNIALAGQVLLLACAHMPGVGEPARGAMLLISLWFFGMNAGAWMYGARAQRGKG